MKHLKFFENFGSQLTIEYLKKNFPIEMDDFYLSEFGKENFYIIIDDKPSYFSIENGLNITKNKIVLKLENDGMLKDERVDVPIVKEYLRATLQSKRFIWIHGLPGSGKSYLSLNIQKNNPEKKYRVLDDIGNMEDVEEVLEEGESIILTSPYFENYSFTKNFDNLKEKMKFYTNYSVLHLWFENDVEACINNLKSRIGHKIDSKYIIPEIPDFSKKYKIPPGARKIPVHKSR